MKYHSRVRFGVTGIGPMNRIGCSISSILTGTVNVWGNPGFEDPTASDYHLRPESAAINAGVSSQVAIDLDEENRPIGSGVDIGADEYPGDVTDLDSGTGGLLQLPLGSGSSIGVTIPFGRTTSSLCRWP